jgi:Tol biopolymer transport system component
MATLDGARLPSALIFLVCLAGCGRISFVSKALDAAPDGTTDSAVVMDAAGDAVADSSPIEDSGTDTSLPSGSFAAVTLVASLSDPAARDDNPSLTDDLLEIYFSSENRAGGIRYEDIWMASRASVDEEFGAPTLVTEVSSTARDGIPVVSRDGMTLWFGSNRTGGAGGWDLWYSTRTSRDEVWSAPVNAGALNTGEDELAPSMTGDGLFLIYHVSWRSSPDFVSAFRDDTGAAWVLGDYVEELNSPAFDSSANLSSDGLFVAFDSERSGGAGASDLYFATRPAIDVPFDVPEPLPGANSTASESDPWISDDGHVLFFASDRSGDREIYQARR